MQTLKVRWANPSILKWARERLNLTPEQVEAEAHKLRRRYYAPVSAQELVEWEEGRGQPELEHLETLSEIYLCPVGYFFLDRPPQEPLPLSFRGLAEEKAKCLSSTTHRTLRRFYELAQWTVDFIESLNIPWEVKIRPGEYAPDPSLLDRLVREKSTCAMQIPSSTCIAISRADVLENFASSLMCPALVGQSSPAG